MMVTMAMVMKMLVKRVILEEKPKLVSPNKQTLIRTHSPRHPLPLLPPPLRVLLVPNSKYQYSHLLEQVSQYCHLQSLLLLVERLPLVLAVDGVSEVRGQAA